MDLSLRIIMLANAGHKAFDTRIFQKEAQSLARHGFDVSIIIPHDCDEKKAGVSILSVPIYRKGWKKLVRSPWLVYKRALAQPKNSWFHLHDSELLWIGVLLKIRGRKVIYDAHEDTPLQIMYQHWIPRWLKKPYSFFYFLLEKICGYAFDKIIVAEPVIAKYFAPSKTTLIRNFPIAASFKDFPLVDYSNRNRSLVYVGLISKARGIVQMAEGAKLAMLQTPFQFIAGGEFSPASLQPEIVNNYPVDFISWVQYDKLIPLLLNSKIGIIVPNPLERYKTNYPVKLFEYMAAGLPVIASIYGEVAEFVRTSDAGILVDPMNPVEIADAITWLLEHPKEAEAMGLRGRKNILEKWNWEEESKTLVELYIKIFKNDS